MLLGLARRIVIKSGVRIIVAGRYSHRRRARYQPWKCRRLGRKQMRTTILKFIGAALIAASTVQMAAATEHHEQRDRAPPVEQFRNSNAYYAAPDYASPENYVVRSPTWSEEIESA